FPEEQVSACLRSSLARAILADLTGRLDGVEDPAVPGAAAQMTVERFRHGLAIGRLAALDQRRRANDDSRDAESALHAALEHERVADRAAPRFGDTLERDDMMSVRVFRLPQARQRRPPVDQHETA